MLWVIFAAMIAAALLLLLLPLRRMRGATASRAAYDLEVYRDQLAEIGRDRDRGVLTDAEVSAARLEIERRMLRAGADLKTAAATNWRWRGATSAALAVLLPAGALALYAMLGEPAVPDRPFAERKDEAPAAHDAQADQIADMVNRLAERLKREPNNPQGWLLLGRSYLVMHRYDDAVNAYRKASELDPENPDAFMFLGEAQIYAADGTVTPGAVESLRHALKLDPKHPGARFYLALQREQAGDTQGAFDGWLALAVDSPADAPWRPVLDQQLRSLAEKLHVDLAKVMPNAPPASPAPPPAAAQPNAPGPGGPSAADVEAAQQMSPEAREQMIRTMVQRLADRLGQQPDDFDGWMRLGRAYQVLGQGDDAAAAFAKAVKLRPNDASAAAALADAVTARGAKK
ncbi:MAG TPA: c-type cytochrome biogenesis protein CcmI [Candidatus Cybelea sp.]|nr:c-type cytochrome biogenesis protein CcmI [Candidatus Cybelea sp.]